MNTETKEALQKSIEHWKRMRDNPSKYEVPGPETCALCQEFFSLECKGCPIAEYTEESGCNNTPYGNAERAFWNYLEDIEEKGLAEKSLKRWKEAAQEEIDFLESLLPDEKS